MRADNVTAFNVVEPHPIEDGGVITMSPAEWATIPDNPRQRDTVKHAKRADHLRQPHPTHAKVNMAILPDGTRIKLDAHTRSYLWETGQVAPPSVLHVQVWRCRRLEHVLALYTTFDSDLAVERAFDKMVGGLRERKLEFKSDLLKTHRYSNAMRTAYVYLFGPTIAEKTNTYDLLGYWVPELRLLDACGPTRRNFSGGITVAALLTLRRYGPNASKFWTAFAEGRGLKFDGRMDAVQALQERIGNIPGHSHSRANIHHVLLTSISAFERHLEGETYSTARGGGIKAIGERLFGEWLVAAKNVVRTWEA